MAIRIARAVSLGRQSPRFRPLLACAQSSASPSSSPHGAPFDDTQAASASQAPPSQATPDQTRADATFSTKWNSPTQNQPEKPILQRKKGPSQEAPTSIKIRGQTYTTDKNIYNVARSVLRAANRQLYIQRDHPLAIVREFIEAEFAQPTFCHYNDNSPVVTAHDNFDALGFPPNHPGRSLSDTYYIDREYIMRTHTSVHQIDAFRANKSPGFLITADVYRRDEIDRNHYPAFHQMEGARTWDRDEVPGGDVAAAVELDLETLPRHDVKVQDQRPPSDSRTNPFQEGHSPAEVAAISSHLKRSLENMVIKILSRGEVKEPLHMRWVEAYFPFTSPSWELEVFYAGAWFEILGCGIVKQNILEAAGRPSRIGWAFGLGLDRLAMLLFKIPDIRLLWSTDERFLSQFYGVAAHPETLRSFKPFAMHPLMTRDISFWLPSPSASPGTSLDSPSNSPSDPLSDSLSSSTTSSSALDSSPTTSFHTNDFMEMIRKYAGDAAESVDLFDQYTDKATGRRSVSYRIVYRLVDRPMEKAEVGRINMRIRGALEREFGIEMR